MDPEATDATTRPAVDGGCSCMKEERILHAYSGGYGNLPPMTAEERAWCLDEIESVEGYMRQDYEASSDAGLARGVLCAWTNFCRDKRPVVTNLSFGGTMSFQLKHIVHWTSQAAGISKTKEGPVVAVVPAGKLPDRKEFSTLYTGPGVGSPRNHESYVIKAGGRLYWPRVSALRAGPAAA
jgi:hypothetical protein